MAQNKQRVILLDKAIIGKRIRQQREFLSLTREEFAERIEISPQFLAEIENGTKGMSAETLYKLCDRLNISADYMLLGRQSTESLQSHIAKLLSEKPGQYPDVIEDILRAFLAGIKMARDEF